MSEEKRDLLKKDRDLCRAISSLPEILWEEDGHDLPSSCIALRRLFTREEMDHYHVDSLVLKKICLSMLSIMEGLREAGICPGLYDMGDIFCDMESRDFVLYLIRPWRFQLKEYEQDYEWYPEDQRLLGDIILFDRASQEKADQRFLFRILTGSARGNVHFPPSRSDIDYAELFYNILPDEWREAMESGKTFSGQDLKGLLQSSIAMEENVARQVVRSQDQGLSEEVEIPASREEGGGLQRVMILVLPADDRKRDSMGRLLYDLQEELEGEAKLKNQRLHLAIVYGNGTVKARHFREYPDNFRFQYPTDLKDYSGGEAMLVAARMLSEETESGKEAETGDEKHLPIKVCILVDGRIKNDMTFRAGLAALAALKEKGMGFFIYSEGEVSCEAFEGLKGLEEEGRAGTF